MYTQVRRSIEEAETILVLAGAGMSADSGLPTYRDKEGFWNHYPLYRDMRKDYEVMMSPYGFGLDPHFAWGFFAHQYTLYKNALPHEGYVRLLELCRKKKDYFVVTSNIDGLFIKAGFSESNLHQAHGSIHALQCSVPCQRKVWHIDRLDVDVDYATMRAQDTLPLCPHCGGVARPNIFMFGDTEESYVWEYSMQSAKRFRDWRDKNLHKKAVILEIGVGAEGMKLHALDYYRKFTNATFIRINPDVDGSCPKEALQIEKGAEEAVCDILNL